MILLLRLFLIFILSVDRRNTVAAGEHDDLLDVPSNVLKIPRNAEEGDMIYGKQLIRASKGIDESLNLELETPNPSPIALNSSIINAGEVVKFILVNKNAFENGKSQLKIQAVGVISGELQEEQLTFEIESNSNLPEIPDIPNFVVKNDFQEKETAIIKTHTSIPSGSQVELFGKYSERVRATYHDDNIILDTIPCQDNEPCGINFPFTLVLVLRNGENHVENSLVFEQEQKKSALKMDQKIYESTIEEHTGEQQRLVKVNAKGNNTEILYTLRDSSGLFSIHPKEGILSILHPEFLTISSFGQSVNLTAVATDGHNTANAIVRIKIAPKIEKSVIFGFTKDIYDIKADNTDKVIGNIKAESAEETVLIYRITEGRNDLYDVKGNGDIEYIGKLLKDNRQDEISVTVQEAAGGLKMASTRVKITLIGIGSYPVTTNDDIERLETISADDEPGMIISSIQFDDKDKDAKLEYKLNAEKGFDDNGNEINTDTSQLFDIRNGDDNQAHLIISEELKQSNISTIRVEITAKDSKHPKEPSTTVSRTIVIERKKEKPVDKDINLIQLPSNISIPMDSPVGSFVYRVVVLPVKENLTFTIEPEHIFNIYNDGSIITKKSLEEETTNIPFHVSVNYGQTTKKVESALILKKRQRAHFTEDEYMASIPRISPMDTVVTLVSAVNSKGEQMEDNYGIKGVHSEYFTIDSQGAIKTKQEFGKDNKQKDYDFLVHLLSDPTISVPVHIHLDDPRATNIKLAETQLFASVFDNLPIDSFVSKIEVIEGGEDVKYTMTSDEKGMNQLFNIEQDGTIRSVDYLSGAVGMHRFSVLASSIDQAGVRSTNATVMIDVLKSNECMPKFKQNENMMFTVKENSPKDTIIGKVSADPLPPKCDISYSLWDEGQKKTIQMNDIVSIDEETGELKTTKEFDHEKQKSYQFIIQLTSGKYQSQMMNSELKIEDVDDNQVHFDLPVETVEVSEDTPPTTVIATVKAIDKDNQPVYYHLGSSSPPQFSLHSTTGQVIIEQSLDREMDEQFEIDIGASNKIDTTQSDWPTTMKLIVKVKDVNDNGPIFERSHYDTVVDKDTVVGSKIIELMATDPDSSDKSKKLEYSVTGASFEYRGMNRNVEDIFDIQPSDAIVYTLHSLIDYVGGVFHVQLQVRDAVDMTIGKSILKVYVHDMSDLLTMELPYKPTSVTPQIVDDFAEQLSNSTNLLVLPKKVSYKAPHGIMMTNSVDLQLIFFNKTSSEILPAERVLAICEKSQLRGLPELRKQTAQSLIKTTRSSDSMIQPELLLIALIFVALLAITLALCGLLMCYYRAKFQRRKRSAENDKAIKDAIHFPSTRSPALISFKHYPSPTPDMPRPIPNGDEFLYRSPRIDTKVGSYAVQQATITVAENEEKI